MMAIEWLIGTLLGILLWFILAIVFIKWKERK